VINLILLSFIFFSIIATIMRPVLCREFAYSIPGFPKPTINFIIELWHTNFIHVKRFMCYIVETMREIEDAIAQVAGDVVAGKATTKQPFWELVRFALVALIIVLPIRFFIAEPFVVSGSSMVPTFENKNYLIIDKISYRFSEPQRGDVIVFEPPINPEIFYIKRIIGLPNETVDVKGNIVTIINKEYPGGFILDQSFIKNSGGIDGHKELKDGEYFVMGDNRPASSDSRIWGAVKRDLITGKAFLRLLPLKNIDIWPGNY